MPIRCVKCKSESLFGVVNAQFMLPLAGKGGGLVYAGHTVTQQMQKDWWHQRDGVDQQILGPVICGDCAEEHTYFKGLSPALRAVSYQEALQYGYDHYAATSRTDAKAAAEDGSDDTEE